MVLRSPWQGRGEPLSVTEGAGGRAGEGEGMKERRDSRVSLALQRGRRNPLLEGRRGDPSLRL